MFSVRYVARTLKNKINRASNISVNIRKFSLQKNNVYYTKTHETIKYIDNNIVKIGVSDYAKEKMGDIVYIDVENIDENYIKGDTLCIIESVKAVSDIETLWDGTIIEHNTELIENIDDIDTIDEKISSWIFKYKLDLNNDNNDSLLIDLMDDIEYKKYIETIE